MSLPSDALERGRHLCIQPVVAANTGDVAHRWAHHRAPSGRSRTPAPRRGQRACDPAANAEGPPGDDRDLAFEIFHGEHIAKYDCRQSPGSADVSHQTRLLGARGRRLEVAHLLKRNHAWPWFPARRATSLLTPPLVLCNATTMRVFRSVRPAGSLPRDRRSQETRASANTGRAASGWSRLIRQQRRHGPSHFRTDPSAEPYRSSRFTR